MGQWNREEFRSFVVLYCTKVSLLASDFTIMGSHDAGGLGIEGIGDMKHLRLCMIES